jgi:hypothetical protein
VPANRARVDLGAQGSMAAGWVALGTPEETVTPQNLRLHHGVDLAVAFPQA